MPQRIDIRTLEPDAFKAMQGLEQYLADTGLDASVKELIKTRASQINTCAFCIQMHTERARAIGETEQRLYALTAWRESPLFSEQERAVLSLTDEVTRISAQGLSDQTYREALAHLGEKALAQAIVHIAVINAWNRIAVSTRMKHT